LADLEVIKSLGEGESIAMMMMMMNNTYDDEVTKTGRDQDIYEHRHMGENLPTRLQV
jgi:hypothetical protein